MSGRRIGVVCAVPLIVAASAFAQTSSGSPTTVRDGVYSAEQAKRGRTMYDTRCAACHDGGTMGPELWGDPFLAEWDEKTVGELFRRIQTTMPEEAPGTLSENAVLDVIAYVLQTNGFPAGDKDIPSASALATVKFVRKK
jgi:S-disulfanyl-L-cysteine oxidoreductase SoxD